jgi:predicted phage terminase large subunit-like protein
MSETAEFDVGFTEEEVAALLGNLDKLSAAEIRELEEVVAVLEKRKIAASCRNDLIAFCRHVQPDYKVGKHHRILANMLMDLAEGRKDRICVNIPPRHGKSQLVSIYFPAWFIGKYPNKKILMVSHTTDLAVDFGRKVRNLIDQESYKEIFPTVTLAADSKSAGRWNTNVGGEYFACGIGSALAGRGADLLLVDDPHNEQDIINGNFDVFDKAYEWFTYGARTRLMPGGRVAIIQTRWHLDDLTGRVTRDMTQNENADQYEVIEFPAILELETTKVDENGEEVHYTREKALWPEFYDLPALYRTKASMPLFQWNAQYQQKPTAEEAAIVKREWWKVWKAERPPSCDYIIMSLDAAAEKHNRADFTAITVWGVFSNEETNEIDARGRTVEQHNIILLNSVKQRVEFPELKTLAQELYEEWEPDAFIVEKKSSGTALYQELRRMGLFVQEYTPHRGSGDKMARLNSVADIIRSGLVWVPETRWAEELVEEIAAFPFARNDDLVDSTVMALMRFRQGGFIRLPTDEPEEVQYFKSRRYAGYY